MLYLFVFLNLALANVFASEAYSNEYSSHEYTRECYRVQDDFVNLFVHDVLLSTIAHVLFAKNKEAMFVTRPLFDYSEI